MAVNGTKFVQHFLGQDGEMVEQMALESAHGGWVQHQACKLSFYISKNIRSDNVMQ